MQMNRLLVRPRQGCSTRAVVALFCERLSSTTQRMASTYSALKTTSSTHDDVMALASLRRKFADLANEDGVFSLLNQKQTETFKKRVQWSRKDKDREAAVTILLCNIDGKPSILFTRRARHLNQHASEISFPGGHIEKSETPEEAALRETCEELLPPKGFLANVEIIGRTTQLPSIRGTPVTPVLALSSNELSDIHDMFPGNPNEVEVVFSASVAELAHNEGSRPIENDNRFGVSYGPTYATPHGTIWGLTAFILRPILHRILKPVYLEEKAPGSDDSRQKASRL